MTDALRRDRARQDFVVRESRDVESLVGILRGERLHAAYALAQMEPEAFQHARCWLSDDGSTGGTFSGGLGRGGSLVCHSRAGLGDATFVLGDPAGVARILSLHPGPFQTFLTARPAHLDVLEDAFRLRNARTMLRMHVSRERFRRVEGPSFRLRPTHARALNRLYSSDGGPTSYRARHLTEGCYFGVEEEGRLLAVAGTHAISPSHGIAVVGNVFTHPQARGRGLATMTTSAVTALLLEGQRDVVLSVDPTNRPAIRAYRRLGYTDVGEIVEAGGQRRATTLRTSLRRLLAGYRGRGDGVEVVRG